MSEPLSQLLQLAQLLAQHCQLLLVLRPDPFRLLVVLVLRCQQRLLLRLARSLHLGLPQVNLRLPLRLLRSLLRLARGLLLRLTDELVPRLGRIEQRLGRNSVLLLQPLNLRRRSRLG